MSKTFLSVAVAVLTASFSAQAFSCGESLFRVGKGVSYRDYTAPLPGKLIVVASTENELAFVERLKAAGHSVTVVGSANELSARISGEEYDIVLAYFSQRDIVEQALASDQAIYLPVTRSDNEEAEIARQEYQRTLATDDSLKRYLKTIHRTLKDRQA